MNLNSISFWKKPSTNVVMYVMSLSHQIISLFIIYHTRQINHLVKHFL